MVKVYRHDDDALPLMERILTIVGDVLRDGGEMSRGVWRLGRDEWKWLVWAADKSEAICRVDGLPTSIAGARIEVAGVPANHGLSFETRD